jgi:predicted adenine nucleotide alpha hydrolase (AANH) superfamily ATPase
MSERLLLHACCGPCAITPTEWLRGAGLDFTLYFFNPNIQPYQEFKRRLSALRMWAAAAGAELLVDDAYPLEEFLASALAAPGERCLYCYRLRLGRAAEFAAGNGFAAFTSTLLGSPYQDHAALLSAGQAAAARAAVYFAYYDFRPGFYAGAEKSRQLGLYRQGYCGCVFSERDRYRKKTKGCDRG